VLFAWTQARETKCAENPRKRLSLLKLAQACDLYRHNIITHFGKDRKMKRTLFLATLLAIFATVSASTALGQASTAQASSLAATGAVVLGVKASNPNPPDGTTGVKTPLLQWTAGETARFHDVYFGTNPMPGTAEFRGRQTWTVYWHGAALTPGTTYYWRIDEVEADGVTIHAGDVWSFMYAPLTAHNPEPPDGAKQVGINPDLSWSSGADAIMHDVYLGTDRNMVDSATIASTGIYRGRQHVSTYDPGSLELGTTYYWRIDEVEPDATKHKGHVWNFTTAGPQQGPTYYVDGTRGSDDNDGSSTKTPFATIQKGIEAARDGDTILVYPGVYRERVNFLGKAITVRSAEDAAVLEAPADFAVSFYMGEGPNSVLKNFVIRNSFIGIFIAASSPSIANVTVVKNKYGIEAYAGADPNVSSSIFWHNSGDDLFGCQAHYSCIQRGGEGQGNLSADPMFVDAENGDYHLRSQRGRYWPEHDVWVLDKVTSPCIDSGDPTADYSEEPRPNGARINMGAYGGTAYASLSETPWLDCDTNRDGVVDMMDYALLAENWLRCCGAVPNQPPYVIITAPTNGAQFGGKAITIELEAHASDIDGIVLRVEFYADGDKIGVDNDGSDGWGIVWVDCPQGSYKLTAKATDNLGATTSSTEIEIEIRVSPPPRR
jgi:hypothetical protein